MRQARFLLPTLAVCLPALALAVALPVSAQAQARTCTADEIEAALAGHYAGPPCRFSEMPDRPIAPRAGPVRRSPPPAIHHPPREPIAAPRGTVVTLPDSFFAAASAGGVERPLAPLYSYRGIIVIDAAGQSSVRMAGLEHRRRVVRAMDRAHRPAPRTALYD